MRNWIKKIKETISEKKTDSSTESENFSEKNIADTDRLKKISQESDGAPDKESNNVETTVKTNDFDRYMSIKFQLVWKKCFGLQCK